MVTLTAREIHRNQSKQAYSGMVELGEGDSPSNYIDKCVLYNATMKKLFSVTSKRNKLKLVKITNPENGRSITREVTTYGMKNVNSNVIAMTSSSLWELGIMEKQSAQNVNVEKGCFWDFYWNNPIHATRISFRVAIYSLCISTLISVVLKYI